MSRELSRDELESIIRPLRTAKWQADYAWSRAEAALESLGKDWGGLELFQTFSAVTFGAKNSRFTSLRTACVGSLHPTAI